MLKVYTDSESQAYLKKGNNDLLFGIQFVPTFTLPQLKDAYYIDGSTSISSVKLIKISHLKHYSVIEETTLPNAYVTYSSGQFILNYNILTIDLDECVYYLQFDTGTYRYKTEPFLAQKFNQKLLASRTYWLASNTDILSSNTNYKI